MHVSDLVCMGTTGCRERVHFDLLQARFKHGVWGARCDSLVQVEHIIRAEDACRDILAISHFLCRFMDTPQCHREVLVGDEILNRIVDPLLIRGDGAVQSIIDFLDLLRLLEFGPRKRRWKALQGVFYQT